VLLQFDFYHTYGITKKEEVFSGKDMASNIEKEL